MNQQNVQHPTLFDLLGRNWQRPAAIASLRFNADATAVGFASANGTIAIAQVAEAEPPESRIRISGDLGQMRILPRSKPPLPLIAATIQGEGSIPFVPCLRSDFLYGAATGEVARLTSRGETEGPLLSTAGPVLALDHSAAKGLTAASDGDHLYLMREPGIVSKHQAEAGSPIKAIAISPDGNRIAGLLADGLAIWSLDETGMGPHVIALPSPPVSIRWLADGGQVACGLQAGGFSLVETATGRTDTVLDFPAPVRTVVWSKTAQALVASGAFRIAAWSKRSAQAGAQGNGALMTGRAGLVLVETVAAHPSKDLVAAGYADGRVVVATIGARDELPVRLGGGAVTALEWSADGQHLAIGDEEGNASIVTFPAQLFK